MKLLKHKKKFFTLVLFVVILLGVAARSVEVINHNYIWGFDHGRDYLLVRDIVIDRNFRLIGTPLGAGSAGFQGIFHGPGYYYFLAIPFILFDGDPYGGVVLMFAFGVAALAIGFYLGRRLFGVIGGLLVVALLSLSPPLIAQSRAIWNSYPTTPFIILSYYFTFLFTKEKKYLYIILASFFAAFTYNFEFAVAVPLSFGLLIYSFFIFKKSLLKYLVLFIGFFIGYLPMILFEIRHNFMAINGVISYLSTPVQKKANSLDFVENNLDHLGSFLFNLVNTFPKQSLIPGLLLVIILSGLFFVAIRREKDKDIQKFFLFLFSLPFVSIAVFLLLRNSVYEYYLVHLNVVYILIFVYSFVRLRNVNGISKYIASFVFLFFIVSAIPHNLRMIQYDINDYGGDAKIKGKTAAIDYIYKDANGKKFGLFVFSPPVYTYPYDYLLVWYAKEKYNYMPHADKKGFFYLLMEVDGSKPWSHEGWQQTVIIDGAIKSEIKLPSGLIVQKRFVK